MRSDLLTYSDKRAKEVQTRGMSEDLVVAIYGNDYRVLNAKAQEVLGLVRGVNEVVEPRGSTRPRFRPPSRSRSRRTRPQVRPEAG